MGMRYLSYVKPHITNVLHILLKGSLILYAFQKPLFFKTGCLEGEKNTEYILKYWNRTSYRFLIHSKFAWPKMSGPTSVKSERWISLVSPFHWHKPQLGACWSRKCLELILQLQLHLAAQPQRILRFKSTIEEEEGNIHDFFSVAAVWNC